MQCLKEDELLDFLAGGQDASSTTRAREHLATCGACNAVATELIKSAAEGHDRGATGASGHVSRAPGFELTSGARIGGRYLLEACLGEGGMGLVWRARDERTGGGVAVKVLKGFGAGARRRFVREIALCRAIEHPGLVRVLDVLEEGEAGCPALVMELLEGEALDRRLARCGPLAVEESVALARGVAETLEAVHAHGVVHRDLKPGNVFVVPRPGPSASFGVKVLDLGLAKILDEGALGPATRLTRTGHAVGTPAYMAPEVLGGERDIDLRADVWSLGVVVFECLTGRVPFEGTTLASILRSITATRPVLERADVGPRLGSLVAAMLARDRRDRPASMRAVRAMIEALG